MVFKNTLKIKHLPKELSESQKEEFIRHFGAIQVKVITSRIKAKSVVYAKFENEEIAKNVMLRLHQIHILNCRLSVEYAENDVLQGPPATRKLDERQDVPPDQKFFTTFIEKMNAFNDSVGFHQPPPSHFKYDYPKANKPTINNIAHALATVPRFYIQVLHLMNKMNLPPPFSLPNPPMPQQVHPAAQRHALMAQAAVAQTQQRSIIVVQKPQKDINNSDESELESDEEPNRIKEVIPAKRSLPQKKIVKRPKFIKQPVVTQVKSEKAPEKRENVFEKSDVQLSRKIELKVNTTSIIENRENAESVVDKSEKSAMALKEIASAKIGSEIEPIQLELDKKAGTTECFGQLLIDKLEKVLAHTAELKKMKPIVPISSEKEQLDEETIANKPTDNLSDKESPVTLASTEASSTMEVEQDEKDIKIETPLTDMKNDESVQLQSELGPSSTSPDVDDNPYISLEELAANQITDFTIVPVFKNYKPGTPTNKLYIKNCAKTVVIQDLEYIFNRYKEPVSDGKEDEFNIRLMQEGRMKGQAFITLNSIEMAQKAVKETNGFILKDKPLVVVFGKAGTKKN